MGSAILCKQAPARVWQLEALASTGMVLHISKALACSQLPEWYCAECSTSIALHSLP